MDQNEMSNLYRGPSIDTSYQVSYHLVMRFQRISCFRNRPIRNKNYLWRPCLLTDHNGMSNSHREPSIDASYHVSVHLAKMFQSRRFLEIDHPGTRIVCGGHVCKWIGTKMSNLYREPSMDASTKFRFIWQSGFRVRRFFRNQSIRNKICLWRPCLLMDRDEMRNRNRWLSIDVSYHVI